MLKHTKYIIELLQIKWILVIILLLTILRFVYWHLTKNFKYWEERGVFYYKPIIFFGNIGKRVLFRTSFHEFQREMYWKGNGHQVIGFFEGRRTVLMVRDPEIIRLVMVQHFDHFVNRPSLQLPPSNYLSHMLLNLKGNHWKNVRTQLTPTFSSGKMKMMTELILTCGKQLGEFLNNNHGKEGDYSLEMKDFFGRFTMDVIANSAFGVQCNSLKDPDADFVKKASHFSDVSIPNRILIFAVLLLKPKWAQFIPLNFMNKETLDFLAKVVQETKQQRMENKENRRNDFLQLMIDAAVKESQQTEQEPVMTERIITCQSLLFLIAGYETSSTLLTMAAYELALNSDIQDKLRADVTRILKKYNGEWSLQAVQDMTYLEMVLNETLRKYPPVARLDRSVTRNYTMNVDGIEGGLRLACDDVVSIPVFGLHYDEAYYPEPQKFDPERFTLEQKAKRSPYVFLPFGAGPRNCIGMRFAMLSTKIALAFLIKDFVLSPNKKTEIPFQYSKFSMLLKAKGGVWLDVKPVLCETK